MRFWRAWSLAFCASESSRVEMLPILSDGVGLAGDAQLLSLVVELLSQYKNVLAEVLCLLPELALDDFAVRLGHATLSLALAPVE